MFGVDLGELIDEVCYVVDVFDMVGGCVYVVWLVVICVLIGCVGGNGDVVLFG